MQAIVYRRLGTDFGVWSQLRLARGRISSALAAWQERERQNLAFARLDERLLADIGLTRKPQLWESARWTWFL